jgi:hypothetical protein
MHLRQVIQVVLLSSLVGACMATTTTVTKQANQPIPVTGLNVVYVNAPLTVSSGDEKGASRPLVAVDVNQLEGAVTRDLPPKFQEKGIPVSVAAKAVTKGERISVADFFPLPTGPTTCWC